MKIRVIGDIHGKQLEYLKLLEGKSHTLQVGDFGMGFGLGGRSDYVERMLAVQPGNHRFIRGNHDSLDECEKCFYWLQDGLSWHGIMCIGGAWSIDWRYRTPGLDWWFDEELSQETLDYLTEIYMVIKPNIMVTHTAPLSVVEHYPLEIYPAEHRTERAFNKMLEYHKPKLWINGHWHLSFDKVIDGTRFVCLNELEHIDIETEDYT